MGVSTDTQPSTAPNSQPRFGRMDLGRDRVLRVIKRATDWLLSQQHQDGYWCGELEGNVMLEADYIFMHVLLGTGDAGKMARAINEILRQQNEDGGWPIYPGGPSNMDFAVKAYLALKLMGWSAEHPLVTKAREWILANGGVMECNTYTKIYLCTVGQYDYDAVPAILPEILLLPNWFYFNIYEISSWSRGILVPLSIIYAKKPCKKLTPQQGIEELFVGGRKNAHLHLRWDTKRPISWRNFFLMWDRIAHWAEPFHIRPLRKMALKRVEQWMLDRFEKSDGLGAIFGAMLNSILAMRLLGYSLDDPRMVHEMEEFEKLGIDCPEGTPDYPIPTFRMQPCFSAVWDTAQVVSALGQADMDKSDPLMIKAADWLLSKEVRHKGDWAEKVRDVEPGGWYFEFSNEFYPDVDDTGEVLLALKCVDHPLEKYKQEVTQRAISWIWAMQCREGGWAAFDKDNTKTIFNYIPFADHNAMLDPPTVDITGRILEMLSSYGYTRGDKRVEKAVQFILKEQEPDGCWFGRWGVNYLYGTFLVLRGLESMGFSDNEPAVQKAAKWIRKVQNWDGGWGESCRTYDDPTTRGIGASTPSQTAWALLGLLAAGDSRSDSVEKGVGWLIDQQAEDGAWSELVSGCNGLSYHTGTGFPRVFCMAYHLYKQYFPLTALVTYVKAVEKQKKLEWGQLRSLTPRMVSCKEKTNM